MTAMMREGGGEGEEGNEEEAVFRTSLDMDMLGEEVIDFDRCDESLLEWEASSRSKGSSSGDTFEEGETNHPNHDHTDHDNCIVGLSSTSLHQTRTREEQGQGQGPGQRSTPGPASGHRLSRDAHSLSSNSSDSALGLHAHRVITTRIHHPPNHSHSPGQSDSLSSSPFYFGDDDHGKTLLSPETNPQQQQQQQQQRQQLNHTTLHHHDASTSSGSSPLLLSSSPCLLSDDVMIGSGTGLATGPELDFLSGGDDTDTHQREHQDEDENVSEGSTIDYNDQQDESSIDSTDHHHNHGDNDNDNDHAEPSSWPHPGGAGGSTTSSPTLADEEMVASNKTPGGKDGDNDCGNGGSSSHRCHSKESHSRTPRQRHTPSSSSSKPTKVNPDLLLLAPPAIIASTLALYPSNTSSLATPTPLSTTMTTTNHQGVHQSITRGHATGRIAGGSTSKCQSDDCRICSLFRPRDLLGVLLCY